MQIVEYPNYKIYPDGKCYSEFTKKYIKPCFNGKNYYCQYDLCNEEGKKKFLVHRLVAEYYIPNIDSLNEVDHIDGNKSNNNIENLRWVTSRQNQHNRKSNNEHINITLTRYETYQVRIFSKRKSIFDKTFKTLSEAIEARDNFYVNNPEIK